jgi:8-oxo-dGTP diphosphatase
VVRHAHAGDRLGWKGADQSRPLTEKGWKQAEALAEMLTGVERLVSSPYLRCRQTLEPLARRVGAVIIDDARLAEGTPMADAMALITAPGPSAAMCTHGDIIVGLVNRLIERGLVTLDKAGGSKASTWKLDIEKGEITRAKYMPPPR